MAQAKGRTITRARRAARGIGKLYKGDRCIAYKRVKIKKGKRKGKIVRRCKNFATKSARAAAGKRKSGTLCRTVRHGRKCAVVCFDKSGRVRSAKKCAKKRSRKRRKAS